MKNILMINSMFLANFSISFNVYFKHNFIIKNAINVEKCDELNWKDKIKGVMTI